MSAPPPAPSHFPPPSYYLPPSLFLREGKGGLIPSPPGGRVRERALGRGLWAISSC